MARLNRGLLAIGMAGLTVLQKRKRAAATH